MDESSLQSVSEIGRHLAKRTRPSKDFIVKSLRKAANTLSQIKQSPQPRTAKELQAAKKQEHALKPLSNAVVCGGLLQHADKEVRLLVAMCVTELFRLMAPEPPFEDKHLRDVFTLIINLFEDLADTASPFFSKRVKVLEIMAQLKCCVIMLEINCLDLVLEMFNIFFSVVRDEQLLISAMTSIMINILYESEEAFQQLLGVVLLNLVKQKGDGNFAAENLAASVIKTCAQEDELNLVACGFLASCIHDRDAMGSGLKQYYYEIFSKVFECAPQMLLSVIPSLIKELSADEVDARIKAVNLVGKLFAVQHRVAQKYPELFVEFLKRFSDKSVDVRISALQCAKVFYLANPYDGTESREIMTSIEDRLLDSDEQVRKQAVFVACDIFSSNLKLVSSKLLSQVSERLRDIKITVRKSALQKLIRVYQDYCKKCYEGSMKISNHFEEIPCKIMLLCYDKDCKEFRFQNMEFVLADDLFPEELPIEERTNHWIHMFSLFSFPHEKALDTILAQKRRFQNEMKNYLAMKKKMKEICPEEMQKKIDSMFTKMAAFFPDSHKAEECLHKLNQIKDNSVFKLLEKLLEEQAFPMIEQTMKDKHLAMIGGSNPTYEFLRPLFSKCSSNIFSSEHVRCILDYLTNNENRTLEDSSANFLLAIVRYFPSMLKGSEKQFLLLLEHKSSVKDKLIEVMAKAGCHMSFNHSDIYPFLRRICLDGTRRQAKFAGSAIVALSSDQSLFRKLYQELIDSLYRERNVPTILQSLGCITQYVSNFETQVEEITSYIFQKIIQMEHLDDGHYATSFYDTAQCSEFCQLKIYWLKTLVKISLHYEGSHVELNINGLLEILSKMLRESDYFVNTTASSCENDTAHIRLAAAKAILRLARKWDLHITPQTFQCCISIAKDDSLFVRSTFLRKIQKLLKEHKLPMRFACAFALAATNGTGEQQYQNYKYMAEFIKDYSILARKRESSSVQGVIIDYPAYILVFLIHVLSRNNDFPFEVCPDEKIYADVCSPLFFILQALVDINIVDGDLDIVDDAILHIVSIFRAIRKVEDAIDAQMTTKLHMLAEIGIFTLNELSHGGISKLQTPGQILLPSSLYRVSLIKNDTSSKCLKSCFEENFLCRVFQALKEFTVAHGHAEKTAKKFPKHGHKVQQDVKKSNINIGGVLDLASTEPNDLSRRAITNAKNAKPDIRSVKRRKCVSGSVGLHECSTIEKQQKIPSKHFGKALESNVLLSSDSVCSKDSLYVSHVQTRKSKRAAACSLENAVTNSKHIVEPFKCPRTKRKDTCGSKDVLEDVSNKINLSLREPGEYSSLDGGKKAAVKRRQAAREETPLNKENTNVNANGKCMETSASEVVRTNANAVRRTRRKV
ncbi:sister chromatid cohesion protein PDS5 homolog B isoform X1 [Vigna umbellata]|uniref:sister chromatid cohesion protein PDS5 homolog B isoform X1 n=1 Tax=Vigna umbellata TaxID=87088 RepID=UPI001F5EA127|nr:sister chromatid cohesion protein PDS5 homolog B isoform X1 [Vigna umbellata]